jgi:hypothetical protein
MQPKGPKAKSKYTDISDRPWADRGNYNVDKNIHKFFTGLLGLSFCHHIGDSYFNFMG